MQKKEKRVVFFVFLLKLLESLNCFVQSRALLFRKDKYMSGHFSLLKIKKEIQREQKLIIGFINNMRRIVVQEKEKNMSSSIN